MKRKQECRVIFGCVLRISRCFHSRGRKFLHFEVAFLTGSSEPCITSLLWFPLLSCYGHPRCWHVVAVIATAGYLSHAQLCMEIDLLRERGVVEEKCFVAAQRAFHAVCVFLIMVTIMIPNRKCYMLGAIVVDGFIK